MPDLGENYEKTKEIWQIQELGPFYTLCNKFLCQGEVRQATKQAIKQ
jgi:hypothetical protein